MAKDTEVIEKDIQDTRGDLTRDVDALADKVSPGRVVHRGLDRTKGRFSSVKDQVMGSAGSATGTVRDAPHNAADSITSRAEGSPLAAGLIAFGAGMLISALIPPSEAEAKVAEQAMDTLEDSGAIDNLKTAGKEAAGNLKQSAQKAASDIGTSAQDSAKHVASDAQSAAKDVQHEATP